MRKFVPALAVLAFLALPGCILAFGGGDLSREERDRVRSIEKRVTALEHHAQGECSESCKLCDHE
jgi:hypothetical protein